METVAEIYRPGEEQVYLSSPATGEGPVMERWERWDEGLVNEFATLMAWTARGMVAVFVVLLLVVLL